MTALDITPSRCVVRTVVPLTDGHSTPSKLRVISVADVRSAFTTGESQPT